MFSKPSKLGGSSGGPPPSIVASDCRITGDIASEGEIQIDGQIEGDLHGEIVVIGEKGSIKGAIVAKTVRVLGTVNGQIKASSVELEKTARVLGDIHHDSLAVAAGAFVEGRFNRLTAESPSPTEEDKALPLPDRNAAGQRLLPAD